MGCMLPDKKLTPVMEEKPAAVKEAEEVFTDAVGEYPDENVENRAKFYLGAARTQLTAAWHTLREATDLARRSQPGSDLEVLEVTGYPEDWSSEALDTLSARVNAEHEKIIKGEVKANEDVPQTDGAGDKDVEQAKGKSPRA